MPWSDVQSLLTRKGRSHHAGKVLRLDVEFLGGRGVVVPRWLANGDDVIAALRSGMRASRAPGASVRSFYVQRR